MVICECSNLAGSGDPLGAQLDINYFDHLEYLREERGEYIYQCPSTKVKFVRFFPYPYLQAGGSSEWHLYSEFVDRDQWNKVLAKSRIVITELFWCDWEGNKISDVSWNSIAKFYAVGKTGLGISGVMMTEIRSPLLVSWFKADDLVSLSHVVIPAKTGKFQHIFIGSQQGTSVSSDSYFLSISGYPDIRFQLEF